MADSTAFLEGKQLLGSEALVVNLACRFDQVLEMGAGEEVAQIDELAVGLILAVDDAPLVLSATNGAAIDVDGLLAAYDGERNERLGEVR